MFCFFNLQFVIFPLLWGEGIIVLYFNSFYHMSPLFTIMQ